LYKTPCSVPGHSTENNEVAGACDWNELIMDGESKLDDRRGNMWAEMAKRCTDSD